MSDEIFTGCLLILIRFWQWTVERSSNLTHDTKDVSKVLSHMICISYIYTIVVLNIRLK